MSEFNADNDYYNEIFKIPWEATPERQLSSRHTRKRKFPGPAGLIQLNASLTQYATTRHDTNEIPCTQLPAELFEHSQWEVMRKDYQLLSERGVYLPDKYNIAWIKTMAKKNTLIKQKAPFLAGIIHKISTRKSTPTMLILKDHTGQINATIFNDFVDDSHKLLETGAIIVLRQVSVITVNGRSVLIITAKNLVKIYLRGTVTTVRKYSSEDFLENIAAGYCRPVITDHAPLEGVCDGSQASLEDEDILQSVFDGIDPNSLFDDF